MPRRAPSTPAAPLTRVNSGAGGRCRGERMPFLACVSVLAALVAAYGAFSLPRVAMTTAREAARADPSPAVLVSAGDANGASSGCPWKSGEVGSAGDRDSRGHAVQFLTRRLFAQASWLDDGGLWWTEGERWARPLAGPVDNRSA